MTQGRLLVENTSELRQEQKWRWGRNPKEGKWLRAQPLESDGPPTSTSEPRVPPLENGFSGNTQQDHECKVLNMVLGTWQIFP